MNVYILDKSLAIIGIIDDYYSLIWAERHGQTGDFELSLPIDYDSNDIIATGNFVQIQDSDRVMIIQTINPIVGDETSLLVSGESAEALLKTRLLMQKMDSLVNAEYYMYWIVWNFIVAATDLDRQISILTTNSVITTTGDYYEQLEIQPIYDICVAISADSGLGFKIINSNNQLRFLVYEGTDRSYLQSSIPRVIFSEEFDNIDSGSYHFSVKDQITAVLVLTDDPIYPQTWVWMDSVWGETVPVPTDLDRVEAVIETTIDRELDAGNPLSDAEVLSIINTRGRAAILEKKPRGYIDGDFDIDGNFKYGVDFFMGDIIHVFVAGRDLPARVVELVRSYTNDGVKTYISLDYIQYF